MTGTDLSGNVRLDLLRRVVDLVEYDAAPDGGLRTARNLIAEAGVPPDAHVGHDDLSNWTVDTVAEWMLGQVADIIDRRGWSAMNASINVAESFLSDPEGYLARQQERER